MGIPDAMADHGHLLITAVGATGTGLAETGRAIPFLAAGVAIGVALLLRAGTSRLDRDEPDTAPDEAGDPNEPD